MLLGTPTVVTDACGIAGYLTDGQNAMVVPANSPRALQGALAKLENPDFRSQLGAVGQQTVEQQFLLPTMVDRYEQLLGKS